MVRAPLDQSYSARTLVGWHSTVQGYDVAFAKGSSFRDPALSSWRSCTQHRGMHSSTVAPDPTCNDLYTVGVVRIRTSFKTILPEDERIAAAVWSRYCEEAAGGCFGIGITAVYRS